MTRPPFPAGRNEPGSGKTPDTPDLSSLARRMIADRSPLAGLDKWSLALEGGSERDMPGEDPYARRSLIMALVAHGLLAAMLVLGVQWVTRETAPMQAELWGALPETAPPPPPPVEVPPPAPEPKPLPKPEPPPPKPVAKPEPDVKADIALKDERKKKKEEERLKKEEEKREREEEKRREDELRKEKLKEEKQRQEQLKAEQQKKLEAERAEQAEKKRQAELEKAIQRELEREREREREKALSDLMNKENQRAMGTPNPGGAGGINRDPTYIDRVIAKIRSNIVGTACDSLSGNPEAIFLVEQLRNGTVVKVAKRKSTGSSNCDDAIERAINKSDPLPTAKEGSYARELELNFKPKEGR